MVLHISVTSPDFLPDLEWPNTILPARIGNQLYTPKRSWARCEPGRSRMYMLLATRLRSDKPRIPTTRNIRIHQTNR